MNNYKIYTVSSLDKVFINGFPKLIEDSFSCFQNERFHFQVCVYSENKYHQNCTINIESDILHNTTIRLVEHIPGRFTKREYSDDYTIFPDNRADIYPDLLRNIPPQGIRLLPGQWQSVWITIEGDNAPGIYPIKITISDKSALNLEAVYTLTILKGYLPKQQLIYTNWIHYDCICDKYNCRPFSKKFYEITGKFIKSAATRGMNMLYIPLFTPPLDTQRGGERRTIQLIDIQNKKGAYYFDFNELKKFLDFAKTNGIKYFEMPHLASQWGAEYCPKIIANVEGKKKKIFGWHIKSLSKEYLTFLNKLLKELDKFLSEGGYKENTFFHISDEPSENDFETYSQLSKNIKDIISGYSIIDAMSEPVFFCKGAVDIPITATSSINNFRQNLGIDYKRWVYYCCAQYNQNLSNRFFNMPSVRNRILGTQLYADNAEGFLHWGFNFYNAQYSLYPINPFLITDADGHFQSGDSFIVYPGNDGPLDSLRLEVFYDGIQDMRALELLEQQIGRKKVLELLKKEGISGYSIYNTDANWLRMFRLMINGLIADSGGIRNDK